MIYLLPQQAAEKLKSWVDCQPSVTSRALARFLIAVFVLGGILLLIVPWQQSARGSGRVVAFSPTDRPQNIDAPVDGRLGKWFVLEGSHVKEGDPIVEILDNDPEIISRMEAERDALQKRLAAAQMASKTSRINLERQKNLFAQGVSARRTYEQAELEYARYLTDEANSAAELSRLEVRLARQSAMSVRAPRAGTIMRRIAGQESELVKAGDSLAVIVPETDSRAVEIWISGNDAPLISEGQHVRLQFEGWPAVQFSGWPSVAAGTFGGKVAFVDPSDNGQGKFRMVIVPEESESWPSSRYLRQGVRAHAWVLLSQVPLGYELWRQYNGFPPALAEEKLSQKDAAGKK